MELLVSPTYRSGNEFWCNFNNNALPFMPELWSIPELWSEKFNINFYQRTFLKEVTNEIYSGEVKDLGDKVKTLFDNVVINKGYCWRVFLEDFYKAKFDLDLLDKCTDDAAEFMKVKIETEFLASIYVNAHDSNKGTNAGAISRNTNLGTTAEPVAINASNIIKKISDVSNVLDEQNVSKDGRWIILPQRISELLGLTVISPNGRLGMIDNFQIYISDLLANTVNGGNTDYHCIAGCNNGITFAERYKGTDIVRSQTHFAHVILGLLVYGYKVIKPEAIAEIIMRV